MNLSWTQILLASLHLTILPHTAWGQSDSLSNIRTILVHNQLDSFHLSALTPVPGSDTILPLSHQQQALYHQDYIIEDHYFIWSDSSVLRTSSDSLSFLLRFRVLPYNLTAPASHFDSTIYLDGEERALDGIRFDPFDTPQPIISQSGLQVDGNFSRGLSAGNRQDLVLNSNFDLRMSGPLGDDIEILAALSDNSIPLQPDGNTQQLQEFDRIFIQLRRKNNTLVGGDFEMRRPASHFMNYFKKTQGAALTNISSLGEGRNIRTSFGIGGSKGKFARINIRGLEGNQGPYRLRGTEGERFIIVLAGTEKIFVDGTLLSRGLEHDYVIDYNAGEIVFTANRIITKDSRIIAEYEYSDQNYNRSVYTGEIAYESEKFSLQFNAYSEQDGTLTSGLLNLAPEDKRFLSEIGDNREASFTSSIRLREEGFDSNIVMYELLDTLGYSDVLRRSTNPNRARYTAKFTSVGQGRGNYIQVDADANGVVFAWVAPDLLTGAPAGTHDPIVQLVAPKQQQMFSLGGEMELGSTSRARSEIAVSRLDLNRFSDLDSDDDMGIAFLNELEQTIMLKPTADSISGWRMETTLSHEYSSSTFQIINPYRNAEFDRDWNIDLTDRRAEHFANGSIGLVKPGVFELRYRYSGLFRGSVFDGNKHVSRMRYTPGIFSFSGEFNSLTTNTPILNGSFSRPKFDISQRLGKNSPYTVGVYLQQERNELRTIETDTIVPASFYHDLARFYIRKEASEKLSLQLSLQRRWDYLPGTKEFELATIGDDFSLSGRWKSGKASILEGILTIRNLEIRPPFDNGQKKGLNYLSKINHQLTLWEGAFRSQTIYEISSGQEPRRTFQYLKVDPGKGVYTWLDLNDDGLQQVNEFEIAPFQEQAEYIRVTILTDEFISTNNILYNQSYYIDLRRGLKNKTGWLAKWSDQGSVRIERKNLESADVSIWSPFQLDIADSSLVSVSAQIRNVLYFNRTNPTYDIQWEWNDFRNRLALTTGFESRTLRRHILRSRVNLSKTLSGVFSVTREDNQHDSESFNSKDFEIAAWEYKPEITWQPGSTFRLLSQYRYSSSKNRLGDMGETAKIHDLKLESVFNRLSTSSLRANLSLVLISFDGLRNTALEFAMLDGLKDGTNWLWGVSYDRTLVNNIRLNISYDGRKSGSVRPVHTARAQISAFF